MLVDLAGTVVIFAVTYLLSFRFERALFFAPPALYLFDFYFQYILTANFKFVEGQKEEG